jgi:tetratricopeptide (TPR) repeat protein
VHYTYLRYYRYGYHPYYWYGSYPTVYEVEGDTYNYYTYNYGSDTTSEVTDYTRPVDANTFADVRERLAAQAAEEPAPETLADQYFEDAVNAFEAGDYDTAANKFAYALDLEPDDMVLPFAYVQALFANQQYAEAVEVLREALSKLPPDTEGIFYPRGLYPDDDILFEQIGQLAATAELYPSDENLQLLLGYQLLGAGKLDRATGPLQQIGPDSENAAPVEKLLELLEKIRTENTEDNNQ